MEKNISKPLRLSFVFLPDALPLGVLIRSAQKGICLFGLQGSIKDGCRSGG